MSQEHIKAELARNALNLCIDRIQRNQLPATLEIMNSIRVQLEWLVSYFEGKNNERNRLHDLQFGQCAARELDQSDAELVTALNMAFYAATQTFKGLKLELSILHLDSPQAT